MLQEAMKMIKPEMTVSFGGGSTVARLAKYLCDEDETLRKTLKVTTPSLETMEVLNKLNYQIVALDDVEKIVGAVFAGNMNALIFSLLGGFSAMLVMILLSRSRYLSIYGVSVGGAAAHNCGQIAAACLTLGSMAPLYYLPILLGASLITGAVTGVAAACLFRALAHTNIFR